jgi:hypothetical protein
MNSRNGQCLKQAGTSLLILIMSIMLVNKASYTHVHILPDGSLTSHAHPFSKSAENNKNTPHQHTSLELYLLDVLQVLMLSAVAAFILKNSVLNTTFRESTENRLLPSRAPVSLGRAPPTCI